MTDDSNTANSNAKLLEELDRNLNFEAAKLLAMDDDALNSQLGRLLPPQRGEPLGALPQPEVIIRRGQAWVQANRETFCRALRASRPVRLFMSNRNAYDTATICVVVAGAIVAGATQIVVPVPLTVAVILTRLGLDTVCSGDWSATKEEEVGTATKRNESAK